MKERHPAPLRPLIQMEHHHKASIVRLLQLRWRPAEWSRRWSHKPSDSASSRRDGWRLWVCQDHSGQLSHLRSAGR